MSLQRQVTREALRKNGELKRKSPRHKFGGHIIQKGIHRNRSGDLKPRELHATKGWRNVSAWT